MLTDEQGRSKCVACGLCPQICPANCIKLVPGEDEQGNRYPLIYEIDEFRCVFCGYCQEVCPEEAIHVGVHYENSEYSRDRFVYDLERLCVADPPGLDPVGSVRPQGRVRWRKSSSDLFAGFAIVSRALLCITRRSPVASALWLVSVLFTLAAIYVLLDAQFIAAMQILVYAGAIMVLFLFVIMLLNVGRPGHETTSRGRAGKMTAGPPGRWLSGSRAARPQALPPGNIRCPTGRWPTWPSQQGAVGAIAKPLFEQYLVPFEITSVLLLAAALVGAVVLAKRKL